VLLLSAPSRGAHATVIDDDLTSFEEACNKVDAEEARRSEPDEVARLAKLSKLEYDRQREEAAAHLGVRVATLDKAVREKRSADHDAATLPHWQVEPSPLPVDGAKLLAALTQAFRRYFVLPPGADIALALWVLHAWTMDAGEISPFMVLVSPTKRCGKTNVLIILYYLTPRSELASNISASALFRYVEQTRPTLLIDEADSFVKENEELRGILNGGHTRTAAYVIRNVEVAGEHKPRRFSIWAPKAVATIRGLADTLEGRSVIVQLQRKPPGATVERLRKRDNEWFAALRSQAARWAADHFEKLADPDPQIPEALNDRADDNWRPLLAIADLAGGEWPQLARQAALPAGVRQRRRDPLRRSRDQAQRRPRAAVGGIQPGEGHHPAPGRQGPGHLRHHLQHRSPPPVCPRARAPGAPTSRRPGNAIALVKSLRAPSPTFLSVQAYKCPWNRNK
jgi:hypothetical protein